MQMRPFDLPPPRHLCPGDAIALRAQFDQPGTQRMPDYSMFCQHFRREPSACG